MFLEIQARRNYWVVEFLYVAIEFKNVRVLKLEILAQRRNSA